MGNFFRIRLSENTQIDQSPEEDYSLNVDAKELAKFWIKNQKVFRLSDKYFDLGMHKKLQIHQNIKTWLTISNIGCQVFEDFVKKFKTLNDFRQHWNAPYLENVIIKGQFTVYRIRKRTDFLNPKSSINFWSFVQLEQLCFDEKMTSKCILKIDCPSTYEKYFWTLPRALNLVLKSVEKVEKLYLRGNLGNFLPKYPDFKNSLTKLLNCQASYITTVEIFGEINSALPIIEVIFEYCPKIKDLIIDCFGKTDAKSSPTLSEALQTDLMIYVTNQNKTHHALKLDKIILRNLIDIKEINLID